MRRTNEPGERIPVWRKFKCGGGAQWTSALGWVNNDVGICDFSGCNCGTKYEIVGTTENRNEAAQWFKLPN